VFLDEERKLPDSLKARLYTYQPARQRGHASAFRSKKELTRRLWKAQEAYEVWLEGPRRWEKGGRNIT
jgi:hypothetical protein